jgi:hypothetical protein
MTQAVSTAKRPPHVLAGTLAVPLFAAAIALVTFAVWGGASGLAAACGGLLAVANWFALRWIVTRIARGEANQRLQVGFLLIAKLGLLMAMVVVLISRLKLDPLGVLLGLSTLFIAPVVSGLFQGSMAASAEQEER